MLQQPLSPSTLSLYHLLSMSPADIKQLHIRSVLDTVISYCKKCLLRWASFIHSFTPKLKSVLDSET